MRILNHDRRSRAGRVWTTSCVLATALFVLPSARAHAEALPADDLSLELQDPQDPDMAALRRELAELRAQNAALLKKLSKLEQKMGGTSAGSGVGFVRRAPTATAEPEAGVRRGGRITALPKGVHVVDREGKAVELEPKSDGIYVVEGEGRVYTGIGKNEAGGGGRFVKGRGPVRYYVSDGRASVYAEVEIETEDPAEAGKTGVLRGRVLDSKGQPAQGARVFLRSDGGNKNVISDPEGRFEVKDVAPGRSQVMVVTPDGARAIHELITTEGDVTVVVRGEDEGEGEAGGGGLQVKKDKKSKAKKKAGSGSGSGRIRIY